MAGKVGNDDQLFEFQSHGDHLRSEFCKVVFICMADFSDETVNVKAFDCARDLSTALSFELGPQVFVLKATDVEFSTCYGFEKQLVFIVKEIEAFVRAVIFNDGFRYLV